MQIDPTTLLQMLFAIKKGDGAIVNCLGKVCGIQLEKQDLSDFFEAIGDRAENFDVTDHEQFQSIATLPAVQRIIRKASSPAWRTVGCPVCNTVQRVNMKTKGTVCLECQLPLQSWLDQLLAREREMDHSELA